MQVWIVTIFLILVSSLYLILRLILPRLVQRGLASLPLKLTFVLNLFSVSDVVITMTPKGTLSPRRITIKYLGVSSLSLRGLVLVASSVEVELLLQQTQPSTRTKPISLDALKSLEKTLVWVFEPIVKTFVWLVKLELRDVSVMAWHQDTQLMHLIFPLTKISVSSGTIGYTSGYTDLFDWIQGISSSLAIKVPSPASSPTGVPPTTASPSNTFYKGSKAVFVCIEIAPSSILNKAGFSLLRIEKMTEIRIGFIRHRKYLSSFFSKHTELFVHALVDTPTIVSEKCLEFALLLKSFNLIQASSPLHSPNLEDMAQLLYPTLVQKCQTFVTLLSTIAVLEPRLGLFFKSPTVTFAEESLQQKVNLIYGHVDDCSLVIGAVPTPESTAPHKKASVLVEVGLSKGIVDIVLRGTSRGETPTATLQYGKISLKADVGQDIESVSLSSNLICILQSPRVLVGTTASLEFCKWLVHYMNVLKDPNEPLVHGNEQLSRARASAFLRLAQTCLNATLEIQMIDPIFTFFSGDYRKGNDPRCFAAIVVHMEGLGASVSFSKLVEDSEVVGYYEPGIAGSLSLSNGRVFCTLGAVEEGLKLETSRTTADLVQIPGVSVSVAIPFTPDEFQRSADSIFNEINVNADVSRVLFDLTDLTKGSRLDYTHFSNLARAWMMEIREPLIAMKAITSAPKSSWPIAVKLNLDAQIDVLELVCLAQAFPGGMFIRISKIETSASFFPKDQLLSSGSLSVSAIATYTLDKFINIDDLEARPGHSLLIVRQIKLNRLPDDLSPKGSILEIEAHVSLPQLYCAMMSAVAAIKAFTPLRLSSVAKEPKPFAFAGCKLDIQSTIFRLILPENVHVQAGLGPLHLNVVSKLGFHVNTSKIYADVFHPTTNAFERFLSIENVHLGLSLFEKGLKLLPKSVLVKATHLGVRIPHGYALSNVFDNMINMSRGLKLLAVEHFGFVPSPYCSTGKTVLLKDDIFDVDVSVAEVSIIVDDDPFESLLAHDYRIGYTENMARLAREKAFMRTAHQRGWKASSLHQTITSTEQTSELQNAWRLLQEFNAKSFVDCAIKAANDTRPSLVKTVIKHISIKATFPNLLAHTVEETLTVMDPITPSDKIYEELIARHVQLEIKGIEIRLRDYPHPILSLPESAASGWISQGLFILADQISSIEAKRKVQLSLEPYSSDFIHITRSVNPPKIYLKSSTTITTKEIIRSTYGASIEPCMADMINVIDTLTKPTVDPSRPVAWWDKVRLIMHGQNDFEIAGGASVRIRVLGSFSPYFDPAKHAGVDGLELVLSSGMKVILGSDSGQEVVIHSGQLEIVVPQSIIDSTDTLRDEVVARFTGGVRIGIGIEFKTFSADHPSIESSLWKNHTQLLMRTPDYCPQVDGKIEWDAYAGFRTSSMNVVLDIKSPRPYFSGLMEPVNTIFLSLGCLNRITLFAMIYQSIMSSMPIRRGRLFNAIVSEFAKPKLGKSIGSIRLQWETSPLFLTILSEFEEQSAGVGVRFRAEVMELDMFFTQHHLGAPISSTVNRKPVSRWNVEGSDITFGEIEGRVLCYGDAVPGFPQFNRNESTWELPEDRLYDAGKGFQMVACVWTPELSYYRRQENASPAKRDPYQIQNELYLARLHQIETAIWKCKESQLSVESRAAVFFDDGLSSNSNQLVETLTLLYEKKNVLQNSIKDLRSRRKNGAGRKTTWASKTSLDLEDTGAVYDHHYTIHNVCLLWNIPVRNGVFKMLELQSRNWGLKYCLTHTAANIVASVVESVAGKGNVAEKPEITVKQTKEGMSQVQAQELLDMLLNDLANGHRLVVPCETGVLPEPRLTLKTGIKHSTSMSNHGLEKYEASTDPESPNFVAPSQTIESDAIVTFIQPQVNFEITSPTTGLCQAVLVAADDVRLQTILILDDQSNTNSEFGMNHALIKSRMIVSLNNAQFFTVEKDHVDQRELANLFLDSFLSASASHTLSQWPAWVPLESLVDHSSHSGRLHRVMEHVNASFYRDKVNPLYVKQVARGSKGASEHYDQYHLDFPDFIIFITSEQYEVVFDVISHLMVYKDPAQGERSLRLRSLLIALEQIEDLKQLQTTVLNLQDKVKQTELIIKTWKNQTVFNDRKLASIRKARKDYADELYVIMEALKSLQLLEQKRRSVAIAWKLFVYTAKIEWIMRQEDNPIFRWSLGNPTFVLTQNEDQSCVNSLEIETLHVEHLAPLTPFKDLLAAYVTDRKEVDFTRTKMLRLFWRELAPVGGIQIVDHLEVNLFPMSIQMTYDMGKQLSHYFFPHHRKGVAHEEKIEPKSPEEASTDKKLRIKDSPVRESSEVKQMQTRASTVKSFIYIKVPGVRHRLSYRGSKEKNFEDLTMFQFYSPTLEYRNKTWSWFDLISAIKKDMFRAALANTGALVREKFFQKKKVGSATSGDDAAPKSIEADSTLDVNQASKPDDILGKVTKKGNMLKNFMKRKDRTSDETTTLASTGSSENLTEMDAASTLGAPTIAFNDIEGSVERNGRILFGKMLAEENEIVLKSSKTFKELFSDGTFSDFRVVAFDNKKRKVAIPVHPNHSHFLKTTMSESRQSTMDLLFDDDPSVLLSILQYCYSGQIKFKSELLLPTLRMAEKLQMSELMRECDLYMIGWLDRVQKKALEPFGITYRVCISSFLYDLVSCRVEGYALQALDLISRHVGLFAKDLPSVNGTLDLSLLPFRYFLHFLCNPGLACKPMDVFYLIVVYIEGRKKVASKPNKFQKDDSILTEEQSFQLFSRISFNELTSPQLETVLVNDVVAHNPLLGSIRKMIQSLMASRVKVTGVLKSKDPIVKDFQTIDCHYSSDFDVHGMIYHLGTLSKPEFKNPSDIISVTMSSTLLGSPSNLTSRDQIQTCTRSERNAWIMLDFGPHYSFQPNKYTLQYGANQTRVEFNNWTAQVSLNGQDFYIVSVHRGDTHLKGPYGTHTWDVKVPVSVANRKWRYFRIQVMNKWFIPVSGIELYGTLFRELLQ